MPPRRKPKSIVDDAGNLVSESRMELYLGAGSVNLTEDDWLVPAADSKGHSGRLQFRIPPAVARAIQEVVQSPKTGFRTDDDFCRFAVWLALRMLQSRIDAIPPSVLMAADAVIRVARDHEQSQMIYEAIRLSIAMCDRLVADGDVQGVNSRIAYIDSVIANLSPTSHWRKKFEEEWKKSSGKYRDWVRSQSARNGHNGKTLEVHELLYGEDNDEGHSH